MALLLASLTNGYVLPGPAILAPARAAMPIMQDNAAAKARWLAKLDTPQNQPRRGGRAPARYSAPSAAPGQSGEYWGVGYGGRMVPENPGSEAIDQVMAAQKKAAKKYAGADVEFCGERYAKGWDVYNEMNPTPPHS